MTEAALAQRELFGGAITLAFPARFDDISEHRQVPDNQEVFADPSLDQSLVVEVVEHQAWVPDAEAGVYFFQDLASVGDAASALITSQTPLRSDDIPGVPADAYRCTVVGEQTVSKGRDGALNKILVCLLVVRLPRHASELLVTLNTPVFISEGSAAAEHAGAGYKPESSGAPALFARIAATLRIHDYGLFGGADG